jgi:hypothetical protein
MRRWLWLALALAGCTQLTEGPALAGYPGLQYQIERYYGARALEENANCTFPRMTVSGYEVVEDTPARLVMNIRYHYFDESRRDWDDDGFFGTPRFRFGTGSCDAFATRTFVVAKSQGGAGQQAFSVQSMTGPQRQLPPNSAMQ